MSANLITEVFKVSASEPLAGMVSQYEVQICRSPLSKENRYIKYDVPTGTINFNYYYNSHIKMISTALAFLLLCRCRIMLL